MFESVESPYTHIFYFLGIEKIDLDGLLNHALIRRMGLSSYNLPSGRHKKRLLKSIKRCLKVSKTHADIEKSGLDEVSLGVLNENGPEKS
jgi:hypothetical protein